MYCSVWFISFHFKHGRAKLLFTGIVNSVWHADEGRHVSSSGGTLASLDDINYRIGLGYIAVPAYKGSLAQAKGACNQTKLV
eukprot:1141057-Pelagomonas_calceolata.AAC.2